MSRAETFSDKSNHETYTSIVYLAVRKVRK